MKHFVRFFLYLGIILFFLPLPAQVYAQNIRELNFGIIDSYPWIQSSCGDIRMENGITNKIPLNQMMITTNPTCTTPGILGTGNSMPDLGQGKASSTNQIVGGTMWPEVYTNSSNTILFSAYTTLVNKARSTGTQIIDLATVCTLSNCTLPNNLKSGVYQANSNTTINSYTFNNNKDSTFLINGELTFNGNIITPNSSSTIFSSSGNIIVAPSVGNATITDTSANLSGIFSTDKSLLLPSNKNCTDLRLNVEGILIINAARTGNKLQNKRDLCADNGSIPTLRVIQRLDFVLNLPDLLKIQNTISREVAP